MTPSMHAHDLPSQMGALDRGTHLVLGLLVSSGSQPALDEIEVALLARLDKAMLASRLV